MKNYLLRNAKSIFMILFGNFIYAAAVCLFLESSGLVTGGVTGISIALGHVTDIPVSVYAFVLNIVMWFLGLFLLGKHFAATTLLSSLAFPVFLGIMEKSLNGYILTDDILLCTVFGGLLIGAGLGIVLRQDASTGGVDVIPLALNKYFRLPVSTMMYIVDVMILLAQILVFPKENLLYGIIHILIYTIVLDKVLLFGTSKTQIQVVSGHYQEITNAILQQADRGVTLLTAEGGYTGEKTKMVLSVISNRELAKIEKLIHNIDPSALLIVNSVSEVAGRGFTLEKQYR